MTGLAIADGLLCGAVVSGKPALHAATLDGSNGGNLAMTHGGNAVNRNIGLTTDPIAGMWWEVFRAVQASG